MERILIVDDDISFCKMLKSFLKKKGFRADAVHTCDEAIKLLNEHIFKVILVDYRLPDKTGLDLLENLINDNSDSLIILMTAYADIRMAVKSIKMGAFEYITKPVNPDEILIHIKKAINEYKSGQVKGSVRKPIGKQSQSQQRKFDYVYAVSQESESIHKYIDLVGPTDMSVIIEGESGTGKEYIARKIHEQSNRSEQPFVAIDCGSLSKELAGSEFFGHIKGSFTGAINDKTGQFEAAHAGTLFLDEIGNLSYEIQVKLLRAIQERKIKKIGSNKDIEIDVRLITATNENLQKSVKEGSFREDLFHRLNEFSIYVNPLRERKEDIKVFAEYFLKMANSELGKNIEKIPDSVWECFNNYNWPGNIREIKNVVRRSVLLASNNHIDYKDLPKEITHSCNKKKYSTHESENKADDLKTMKGKSEKEIIVSTLEKAQFNKSKAAKILKIDRKTLYNKLKLYGIMKS